jgi:hypothetical protein
MYIRYEEQLAENGFARWTYEDHDSRFEALETNYYRLAVLIG